MDVDFTINLISLSIFEFIINLKCSMENIHYFKKELIVPKVCIYKIGMNKNKNDQLVELKNLFYKNNSKQEDLVIRNIETRIPLYLLGVVVDYIDYIKKNVSSFTEDMEFINLEI